MIYLRLVFLMLIFGGWVRADIDQGLVAYYSFDGDEPGWDCSGQGHDAVSEGRGALESGRKGDALSLNGRAYLVADSLDNFDWGNAFTLSLWFRCEGAEPAVGLLLSAGDRANPRWQVDLVRTEYGVGVGVGLRTENLSGFSRNFPVLPLSAGEWYHFAMVYDDENASVYWSGTKIGPNIANRGAVGRQDGSLLIGEGFVGVIDEVRLYNRALSLDEVRTLRRDEPGRPAAPCKRPVASVDVESVATSTITIADREATHLEVMCCKALDSWVEMYRRDEQDALGELLARTSHRTLMWDALVQMADPALAIPDDAIKGGADHPCTTIVMGILATWKKGERLFALQEVKKLADRKAAWERKP